MLKSHWRSLLATCVAGAIVAITFLMPASASESASVAAPLVAPHALPVVQTPSQPFMTSTFLQPSINASYPTINWSADQYREEFLRMGGTGLNTVIVQWTIDQDANQSYFSVTGSLPPQTTNMVGNIFTAKPDSNITDIWLGLANTYNWQAHAGDSAWLQAQALVDEQAADRLYTLYGSQIKGWYISNEVDDGLLATPADVSPMSSFFNTLTTYLHTHDGNLPVMTSPRYSSLNLSPEQFASKTRIVMGTFDVINVQDGGGSGYIHAADIKNWFTSLSSQFPNNATPKIWQNADMFGDAAVPATLQANLQATKGLVSGYSGFSFTTQLDPAVVGYTKYNTMQLYVNSF